MSLVYLAENLNMGQRKEALKILNDSQMRQSGSQERFDQEIAVAAQLYHPNIVTAFNSIRLPSLTVFAMQYVEGQDLEQYIRSKGPLRIATACGVIRQVAAGLQYAMEKTTIHRDIKPANLMLTKVGAKDVVKILDFGLAKAQLEAETDVALTATGMGMGTPQYMAPEQLLSASTVDIRADIYSLGCTLYFLLTGKAPFNGTQYEIYHAHQTQDATSLNLIRSDVPVALAAVVAKMMAKEPSKRFQRPDQVAAALAPFLELKSSVPANMAGPNACVAGTSSVPVVRQVTQIETVPPSIAPAVNVTPSPHAMLIESLRRMKPPEPLPNGRQTPRKFKVTKRHAKLLRQLAVLTGTCALVPTVFVFGDGNPAMVGFFLLVLLLTIFFLTLRLAWFLLFYRSTPSLEHPDKD